MKMGNRNAHVRNALVGKTVGRVRWGALGAVLVTVLAGGPLAAQYTPENTEAQVRFAEYGSVQEVEGEELYKEARAALNRGDHEDAAMLFEQLRRRFPESVLVGDSYYYQAFALYRMAREQEGLDAQETHHRAMELIDIQANEFGDAATRRDAQNLRARIDGALARSGDADARRSVGVRAQEACDDEEDETRVMALSALMNMDPARAQTLLREVIADRDACNAELRAQAVFILAQNDDESTVELLLDIAHRNPDPDPEVRGAAVFWLSQVNRPEAVDALLAILEAGGDTEMMEGALFALSQHNDPRAFDALLTLLRTSSDPEIREHAIFAVSQHGAEAAPILRAIAIDEGEDPEVRGKAIFWLGQNGAAVSDLLAIYESASDVEVKNQTLFAISQSNSTEAVDLLMDVARSEEDPEIRQQAIFWLGQSDDPRVPQFLLELIRR